MNLADDAQKIYKQPVGLQNPYNDLSSSIKSTSFLPALKTNHRNQGNRHSSSLNTLKNNVRDTELGFDRYGQRRTDADSLRETNQALMK